MGDDLVARARASAPEAMNGAFLRELAAALEAKDARIAELAVERDAALRRAEEAELERDLLRKVCKLTTSIHTLTDAQLAELRANAIAAQEKT